MTLSAVPPTSCDRIETFAETARIFNIQRYSLNDGQGIRTVVFFKGCPHTCPWCANPESISPKIETVRRESLCLHCATCLQNSDECPSGAWENIGDDMTLAQLEAAVLKDEIFFRTSGGGVTLSGGEVLMQAPFATRFLHHLKQWGIRTAIETAGDAPSARLLALAAQCDEVLFDLKIMDVEQARHLLNINQPRVLDNFRLLVEAGVTVIPRLPLIPGYTLSQDNVSRILAFLAPFHLPALHLLPFHHYGDAKYRLLHREYPMAAVAAPSLKSIEAFRQLAEQAGYHVTVGG